MKRNIKIEICAGSVQSALAAEQGGADRIELCSALSEGGLTPSPGIMKYVCDKLSIPVFMLIRPRAGDFCYSDAEFETMVNDIAIAVKYGAKGIVCGILNPDGSVDTIRMKEIIRISSPLPVTFHRAFDMTRDPFEALEEIINLGCSRLLTSGQAVSAPDGADLIKKLTVIAAGKLIIMPGSGIKPSNFFKIAEITGAREFHLSAARTFQGNMQFHQPGVKMSENNKSEYEILQTDPEFVAAVCQLAKSL